jgi:hypothetical protein
MQHGGVRHQPGEKAEAQGTARRDSAESEDEKEWCEPRRHPTEIDDRPQDWMGKREKGRQRVASEQYGAVRSPHATTTAQKRSSAASIARASFSRWWS